MSNNWQISEIGDQIDVLTDYTANGSFASLKENVKYYNEKNYAALVRTTDLEKKVFAPERFTDQKGYNFLKKSALYGGEIVIANVGSTGKVYIVPNYPYPMTLAPNMYLIKFKPTVDNMFGFQLFSSSFFQTKLKSRVASTTLSAINKTSLKTIKVPIPSVREQRKIASILMAIDDAIQKTDQIIEKSEQIKKSYIQGLFNSKSGINWPRVKLSEVAKKITDGTHRTPKYIATGIPFLRINDIQSEKINWERVKYISEEEHNELVKRCHPEKGDVLLSKNGTIGITKIVDWERDFSIFVSLCLIKPDKNIISPEYLNMVLSSDYLLSQIKKRSKQGTVTNLHLEEIRDLTIALPNINEQLLVTKQYDFLIRKLNNELHYKEELIQLKNGLMNDIFSQKVEVN